MTTVSGRGGAARYSDVEYVFEPHGSTQQSLREYVQGLWDRRRFIQALANGLYVAPPASPDLVESPPA